MAEMGSRYADAFKVKLSPKVYSHYQLFHIYGKPYNARRTDISFRYDNITRDV
jgi:hypothetical protein